MPLPETNTSSSARSDHTIEVGFAMFRAARTFLFATLCACGATTPSTEYVVPQTPIAKSLNGTKVDSENLRRELDAFVLSYGRNWGEAFAFSGYVHVVQGNTLLYSKSFGARERATGSSSDADTSFRIGSVTKQFTAAAILLLEQEGKLRVEDRIGKYLSDYPALGADITIHQLLSHTAGIPNYTTFEELMKERDKALTPVELMTSFWNKPLEFEPGSSWNYSNSGYVVLGVLIEKLSGMSYAKFMKTKLFVPAKLSRTEVGDAVGQSNRAIGYQVKDGAIVPAEKISMSVPFAAGAVRSTASDLVRWHNVLLGQSILSESSKAKLYAPVQKGYAYGWNVKEKEGHRILGHGGGIDGFLTSYMRVMDEDLIVVVLSNNTNIPSANISEAAIQAAFGAKLKLVAEPKAGEFDLSAAKQCVGDYALTKASREWLSGVAPAKVGAEIETMTVTLGDATLRLKAAMQPEFSLTPTVEGTYMNTEVNVELRCTDEGDAGGIEVLQRGASLKYLRVTR